jgi:hypothetical protein
VVHYLWAAVHADSVHGDECPTIPSVSFEPIRRISRLNQSSDQDEERGERQWPEQSRRRWLRIICRFGSREIDAMSGFGGSEVNGILMTISHSVETSGPTSGCPGQNRAEKSARSVPAALVIQMFWSRVSADVFLFQNSSMRTFLHSTNI